jgi:lysophospholipase L1-like esterase
MITNPLRLAALLWVAGIAATSATAQTPCQGGHWVAAWSTAVHTPIAFPGAPPPLTVNNQTLRQIIRPTLAGDCLRVRFSNEFGTTPLLFGSVHLALTKEDGTLLPGSDRPLTFNGKATVQIPAGAPMLSDPIDLKIPALANIAISLYVPKQSLASTFHQLGQQPTAISGPGDFTSAPVLPNATQTHSWYWLSDLEVRSPEQASALVTLGDSITDGFGGKPGGYQDWPDLLAERLTQPTSPAMAIDNEGIGGNRILYDGAGVSALARFDRDVLAKPGVTTIILLEGINDIGWPHMKPPGTNADTIRKNPFADQVVTADDLILGMKQIVGRAHAHGIKIFGATITPYEGAGYFTAEGEAIREAVNNWIRTSHAFDGVVDFDAAVRDPGHPNQFRDDFQSGDYLHPNAAGYKAMAAAIDLTALRAAPTTSPNSAK